MSLRRTSSFSEADGTPSAGGESGGSPANLPVLDQLITEARSATLDDTPATATIGSGRSSANTSAATSPHEPPVGVDFSSLSSTDSSPLKRMTSSDDMSNMRRRCSSIGSGSSSPNVSIPRKTLSSVSELQPLGSGRSLSTSPSTAQGTGANNSVPQPLSALYQLLILPMEEVFAEILEKAAATQQTPSLFLVLQDSLHLVPYSLLRATPQSDFLHRRFNLVVLPFLSYLRHDFGTAYAHKNKERSSRGGGGIVDNKVNPRRILPGN